MKCAVVGCKQYSHNKAHDVHFFCFPKTPELLKSWMDFTGRIRPPTQNHRICSLHFRKEDLERNFRFEMGLANKNRATLKPNAVPSIKNAVNSQNALRIDNEQSLATLEQLNLLNNSCKLSSPASVDLDLKCRTCLAENIQLWSIFDETFAVEDGELSKSLSQILSECNKYQIKQFDGFPQSICLRCIESAQKSFLFKRQVELSYETLLAQLNATAVGNFKIKHEPDEEAAGFGIANETATEFSAANIGEIEDNAEMEMKFEISSSDILEPVIAQPRKVERGLLLKTKWKQIRKRTNYNRAKRFPCYNCAKSFAQNRIRKLHNRIHLESKPLRRYAPRQHHIGETTEQQQNKQAHLFACEFCSTTFKHKGNLNKHRQRHIAEKSMRCEFCQKGFATSFDLKRHMKTHNKDWSYACNQCSRRYNEKRFLIIHARKHTGERPYACDQCPKRFASDASLKKHKIGHTEKYKCEQCSKCFAQAVILEKHRQTTCLKVITKAQSRPACMQPVRLPTGEKRFKCDQCPKEFIQRASLIMHYRHHTGEKPYKCEQCSASFSRKGSLNKHKETHAQTYACKYCSQTFSQRAMLICHEQTHASSKLSNQIAAKTPFACDLCPKMFVRRDSLNVHYRTHTGDKLYKCNQCLKVFCRKDHWTTHKRTHDKHLT